MNNITFRCDEKIKKIYKQLLQQNGIKMKWDMEQQVIRRIEELKLENKKNN